jgi:hypothetical protein
LHISHRVRERAPVQGITLLAADLVPDLREQETSGLPLALVAELHRLANPGDRWVGDHYRFFPGSSRDSDRTAASATNTATRSERLARDTRLLSVVDSHKY